jgi:hypothetical protein
MTRLSALRAFLLANPSLSVVQARLDWTRGLPRFQLTPQIIAEFRLDQGALA